MYVWLKERLGTTPANLLTGSFYWLLAFSLYLSYLLGDTQAGLFRYVGW